MARYLDRAQMNVSGAPGTGAVTLNAATSGYQTYAAAATGQGVSLSTNDTLWVLATDGSAWEIWEASITNTSGPVLSAPSSSATGFQSSTGSVLSLSSSAIFTVVQPALIMGLGNAALHKLGGGF